MLKTKWGDQEKRFNRFYWRDNAERSVALNTAQPELKIEGKTQRLVQAQWGIWLVNLEKRIRLPTHVSREVVESLTPVCVPWFQCLSDSVEGGTGFTQNAVVIGERRNWLPLRFPVVLERVVVENNPFLVRSSNDLLGKVDPNLLFEPQLSLKLSWSSRERRSEKSSLQDDFLPRGKDKKQS